MGASPSPLTIGPSARQEPPRLLKAWLACFGQELIAQGPYELVAMARLPSKLSHEDAKRGLPCGKAIRPLSAPLKGRPPIRPRALVGAVAPLLTQPLDRRPLDGLILAGRPNVVLCGRQDLDGREADPSVGLALKTSVEMKVRGPNPRAVADRRPKRSTKRTGRRPAARLPDRLGARATPAPAIAVTGRRGVTTPV